MNRPDTNLAPRLIRVLAVDESLAVIDSLYRFDFKSAELTLVSSSAEGWQVGRLNRKPRPGLNRVSGPGRPIKFTFSQAP